MTRYLNRRQFLIRLTSAGLGAIATGALTACVGADQPKPAASISPTSGAPDAPTPAPAPTGREAMATAETPPTAAPAAAKAPTEAAARDSSQSTAAEETPTPVTPQPPDVAVVVGPDPSTITRAALAALGGIERFVSPGHRVIVKPNVCISAPPEQAATTNPEVVGALVEMCLEAGASTVQVMDYGFSGHNTAYRVTQIEAAVERAGGQLITLNGRTGYVDTPIPEGKDIRRWPIYADALAADVLINVPIAKHHGISGLTLGVKNLMGLIQNRGAFHINLGQRLPDLLSVLTPTITVVDAVRILLRHGPSGGDPNDVAIRNTVIVSTDTVAADSYAAGLFDRRGDDIDHLRIAAERGLGVTDLSRLRIAEIEL